MAGSTWQQYYAPQIAARNRWVDTGYTGAVAIPRRSGHRAASGLQEHPVGVRSRFAAAGVAAGSVVVTVLGVLGMHSYRADSQSVQAPAVPVAHSAPAPVGMQGHPTAE